MKYVTNGYIKCSKVSEIMKTLKSLRHSSFAHSFADAIINLYVLSVSYLRLTCITFPFPFPYRFKTENKRISLQLREMEERQSRHVAKISVSTRNLYKVVFSL